MSGGNLLQRDPMPATFSCASSLSAPKRLTPQARPPQQVCPGHAYSAGSCSQPHAAVTSPGACLQELVSDPAHFIPNLLRNLNDCVSPDTLPCAGTAVLHAHPRWWVLLDIAVCPQHGGASPFPHPCLSFGVNPFILYPKDFPPELFAIDLPSPPHSIISPL